MINYTPSKLKTSVLQMIPLRKWTSHRLGENMWKAPM